MIFEIINKAPGIRYKELLRSAALVNGVLSSHLKNVEKKKLVEVKRLSFYHDKVLSCNREGQGFRYFRLHLAYK